MEEFLFDADILNMYDGKLQQQPGGIYMRAVSDYRPSKMKKLKNIFLTMFLLVMAFLAGAVAEKSADFLQDVMAAAPVALDGFKTFLRERVIFKVKNESCQVKWATATAFTAVQKHLSSLIRGP